LAEEDEKEFDSAKAELFEAIGHPNRIRIIQALDQGGMGFGELKKKVGMESSGHLAFHLGKLEHLVAMDAAGQYVLTGEGREALRMIQTVRERGGELRRHPEVSIRRPLLAGLLLLIVVLASVAAFQQLELANSQVRPPGTTVLDGRPFSYAVIPLTSLPAKQNTTIWFGGVEFTLIPNQPTAVLLQFTNATEIAPVKVYQVTNGSNLTGEGVPVTVTISPPYFYNVEVRFADGRVETVYPVPSSSTQGVVYYSVSPAGTPWFSVHRSPQAAVSENMTAVTLYVSV
jgi:DNA-binding transcriptional ArsR family regulator